MAVKYSIDVGAGVIDSDSRGEDEVKVLLFNFSDTDFKVIEGDRIAQMIITKYTQTGLTEVQDLEATVKGDSGFCSIGLSRKN